MSIPKRITLALVVVLSLVGATLIWAPPEALLTLTAPSEVNKCEEATHTLTIASTGSDPMEDIEATVTVPTGYDYVSGSTVITFPGGSSNDEPTTGDDTLYWDLGSVLASAVDHVVVNEFEPNPYNNDTGREWAELYNPTAGTVDISSWTMETPTQTVTIPFGTTVGSGGYYVYTYAGLWLPDVNSYVILRDSTGTEIDRTLTASDGDNSGLSWQRVPNGGDTDSDGDWQFQSSTQGATNGGVAGALSPGDTITVGFQLRAGCDVAAGGGYRLSAKVQYDGVTQTIESNQVTLFEGHLKIEKSPGVIEATIGDTVAWDICIENNGFATIYNISISDTLKSGLTLLSQDAPSWPNWSYDSLAAGEVETVSVSAVLNACNELFNVVTGYWGCDGDTCGSWYNKASIKYIVNEPYMDYALTPDPIVVPYCESATNNRLVITNTGPGDADSVSLVFGGIVDPYQITNVVGATYFATNDSFFVGPITPNDSAVVTFDLGLPSDSCSFPSGGVISMALFAQTECNEIWYAPTKLASYQFDSSTSPSLSASKTGPGSLYSGENGTYTLSVTYDRGNCPATFVVATISDTVPDPFGIVDAGGGSVAGNVITWSSVTLNDGVAFVDSIVIQHGITDPCGCGQAFSNVLQVTPAVDCCNCTLSAGASQPIVVRCDNDTVFTSGKSSSSPIQNCTTIDYVTTYNFFEIDTLEWGDIDFTEQGNNGQTFPSGADSGLTTFVVDSTCSATVLVQLGTPENLAFLTDSCGAMADSTTLDVKCTLYAPNAGSFYDWSVLDIAVPGFAGACSTDRSFYDAAQVDVGQSDYSLSLTIPNKLNSCGTYNMVITVTQNGSYYGYDMRVAYDGTNFRYIGPSVFSGWTDTSGATISSFEPTTIIGTDSVYWDMGDVDAAGTISFDVLKTCPPQKSVGARLDYEDNCGNSLNDETQDEPLLLDIGDITIKKTPEVVFALTDTVSWKIYISNTGPGTAFNVMVYDTMDTDLKYYNSLIDGVAKPGSTSVALDSQSVVWNLGDLVPQQQRIISLTAELTGCDNMFNRATATWGCGGDVCESVEDSSVVELLASRLMIARHEAEVIDQCGAAATFTTDVFNIGQTNAYDIEVTVWLPPGLQYVTGSSSVADSTPTSTDFSGNPLIWRFFGSGGWAPGAKSTITFQAQVTDTCSYAEVVDTARVTYTVPCGDAGTADTRSITPQETEPHLVISKTPSFFYVDNGDTLVWVVKVVSDGDDTARVIRLEDILPANTTYLAGLTSPAPDGGTGTGADPL
ncbi:MAG: lamin tail domain-containing protein [bacterium]